MIEFRYAFLFWLLVPAPAVLMDGRLRQVDGRGTDDVTAERRALEYLIREVPRWSAENKCYSCHNNGDGARALYLAMRLAFPIPQVAVAETTRWLQSPERWDHNGGEGASSDRGLARIQFAAALVAASDAGQVREPESLLEAAGMVAGFQQPDGSWQVDAPGMLGSPGTYGTCLATSTARAILQRASSQEFRERIARADRWLRSCPVHSVLDAAGVLLGLGESLDNDAREQRDRCLSMLRRSQAAGGGWGPYPGAPPEPFDTAIALLAVRRLPRENSPGFSVESLTSRGREFLTSIQLKDGSWRESTRPAGAESYAQRLSTTAWATQALLVTAERSVPPR